MNHFHSTYWIILTTLLIGLFTSSCPADAHWTGRLDLGGYPVFFDDPTLEDRTPLTSGFRLNYSSGSEWVFKTSFRLRSEANSPDGNIWRVRDLFIRYGRNSDASPFVVTAGLFSPDTITGCGDVMGAGLQFNARLDDSSHIGFGAFGGANSVVLDGATDADGVRFGGYISAFGTNWGRAGIAYISVTNTDLLIDETNAITFNTSLRFGDRFDVHQTGEYIISSHTGEEDNKLISYYGDAGFDITENLRMGMTYDYYDRLPFLASLIDDTDPATTPEDFDRIASYSGSSIGPRLDVRIGKAWRLFGRYRYRETNDFLNRIWHQYLGGFSYTSLSGRGLAVNGSVFVNRGDTRDYETGFLRISRGVGSALNLSLNLAADRFSRPETVASTQHVEFTWRAGISGFYRIRSDMTAILEYERTFADSDNNSDHRVMFNWQYRF
ncbi:hypothetical protein JW823_01885 [bacterium]|nr:hypothetical protein [candidate division CSSED10-310 bacterium]